MVVLYAEVYLGPWKASMIEVFFRSCEQLNFTQKNSIPGSLIHLFAKSFIAKSQLLSTAYSLGAEGLNPPFYIKPSLHGQPTPFLSEFLTFDIFWQYRPNETGDKHKYKLMRGSYFFMFRGLQNNITCFFCGKKLCTQHDNKIWFTVISISSTKKELTEKYTL